MTRRTTPGLIEYDHPSIYDEEWFGPLLSVQYADDLDSAIELANRTKFGLAAGLISDDVDTYHHFVQRIRAGIVNWNRQTTGASGKLPFGASSAIAVTIDQVDHLQPTTVLIPSLR